MTQFGISYRDLRGIDSRYVEKLKKKEPATRRALRRIGRQTPVEWSCVDDGRRNYTFRLLAATDRHDCIAEVLPLDLTLAPRQFESLLVDGKRPCHWSASE